MAAKPTPYRPFGTYRLLLAVMVFVQHALQSMAPPWVEELLAPLQLGSMAVLVFFALSGFIVTEAAVTFYPGRPASFLANRLLRIYPSYLIALLFTVGLAAVLSASGSDRAILDHVGGSLDFSASELAANAFGILPGGKSLLEAAGALPIIDIAWALRVELGFYFVLFMAMVAALITGLRQGPLLAVLGMGLLLAWWAGPLRMGMLQYIPHFVFGTALYFAVGAATALGRGYAGLLAAVSFLQCLTVLADQPGPLSVFAVLVAAWLALLVVPARGLPASVVRWDKAAGDATYSVYLLHTGTCMLVSALLPDRGWPALLSGLALSLGAAMLATMTYEKAIGRLRERVRGVSLSPADAER